MPRNLALAALNNRENAPGFQERTLEGAFLDHPHLDQRDRAFSLQLVQGVLRWRIKIDWIIKQNLQFPFARLETPVLNILRLAVYQIFFLDRVPESAAVNEAVKQAGRLQKKNLRGVVNGILRNICRKKDAVVFPNADRDAPLYLAVAHSYPLWLVKKWIREYGRENAEKLLRAGNNVPGLFIRTNTLYTSREKLVDVLKEEGVDCAPCSHSPEGIEITRLNGPISGLRAFRRGLFQVQSLPAQICSHLLFPRSGESVLDVCAGFGGKSTHISALMKDQGLVLALDTNRKRMAELMRSAKRLKATSIQPLIADATRPISSLLKRAFDKVLVDAPCSGLGVISRHPDIKLARSGADIERLADLQQKILTRALETLKPEGALLFVTCTLSKEENEDNVERFLQKNPRVALADLRKCAPPWAVNLIDEHGFFRTLPHVQALEGFFAALFRKK